nr:T9SS type A sorting domain-containing protein [Bacteroidota bacterium]
TSSYLFDICFADQYNGWAAGVTGLILHTNDGGANWYELDPPANNSYFSLCFTDSQSGWASGFGGKIIHTDDGGETWESQVSGVNTFLYDIFFVNENEGWAVGGDNGTFPSFIKHRIVLHTVNGGDTWTSQINQSDQSLLYDAHFLNENTGYAVGESGIVLQTTNGGSSWSEKMSNQSYHFYSTFFLDAYTGFVVGTYLGLPHVSVIFSTNDCGTTWESQTFGTDESLGDIFFVDEMNGWAVGSLANSAIMMNTTDGGTTWDYADPGTDKGLSSVYFIDNDTGWAAGHLGTIVSTRLTTGIDDEPGTDNSFSVYPNPASDKLSVDLTNISEDNVSISLLNTIGQTVYKSQNGINSHATFTINTSSFSDGLYTLILEGSDKFTSQKVIIKR